MTEPTTLRASGEMNQWVVDINAEICKHSNAKSQEEQSRKKRSIYRLPSLISETKKGPYQPQAVSFGPNHHGELHLMPMEEHKHRALLNFVHRSPLPLGVIFNAMVEVAQELKDSYSSLDSKWQDTEKFVKLMIIDGCFMLEILRAAAQKSESDRETQERGCDYSKDDPIFGSHGELYAMPFTRQDMLLLFLIIK
ncbi:UPF0481 protein At3g47200-like [Diospyros lotus]|uniref:UPF0481 protein At3g47200-like n=1 Tax=Diospyros lotus TaxID=55363 RepID=UPI0022587A78|nr:UPF0481 protein At3g47200-like [Diospyros lotus]